MSCGTEIGACGSYPRMGGRWIGRGGQMERGVELDGQDSEKGNRRMLAIEERLVPRMSFSFSSSK
jgi:hypothetical protein